MLWTQQSCLISLICNENTKKCRFPSFLIAAETAVNECYLNASQKISLALIAETAKEEFSTVLNVFEFTKFYYFM